MFEPKSSERILVIDDDESICRTIQMILNAYGYSTEYVHSGKDAIEKVKENQFSLAVVDVRLPDIDGTMLVDDLHKISPDMDVVMITGHATIESALDALKLGANAYIIKPLDMDEVLRTVSATMERQSLIHQKQRAEDALRKSESWFRNIFNDSPIAINVFDTDGNFIDANQALLDFAGVTDTASLKGFNIFDDPNLSDEMKENLRGGKSVLFESEVDFKKVRESNLYRTTRSDIAYVQSAMSPLVFDKVSGVQGYMVQIADITKRRTAEQEVIDARDKAQLYLETAGVMFIALDENANITLINQRGCEILKTTQKEALGKNWISTFIPRRIRAEVYQVFTSLTDAGSHMIRDFENPVLATDGTERIIRWNNTLLKDANGYIIGVLSSGIDVTERRKAEAALGESEDKFRRVFDASPIGVEILDNAGVVIDMNPAALKIFGVEDKEKLIGFDVLADPNTPTHVKDLIRKKQPYRFESTFDFELVKKNRLYDTGKSGIRYLDTVLTPLGPRTSGDSAGIMIQFQDVTVKVQADAALRESEERWRSYTQGSPDQITLIDCNFIIQFSNRPSKGQSLNDMIGKSIITFMPDDQVEHVRGVLTHILETGEPAIYDTRYCSSEGSPVFYETRAIPRIIDDEIVGIMLSSREITERKLAEQQIEYQASLLQNISDAVISEDLEFHIKTWNKAAENMYGWTSEEAIGKSVVELLHNEYSGISRNDIIAELDEAGTWVGHMVQTRKDGSEVFVLTAISFVHNLAGERSGIVAVNHDISERIAAERKIQSERDLAMLYLDLMGHDIRNKLQTISIGLEVVETLAQDDTMKDVFADIHTSVEKCSQIISAVKKTERLTEAPLEPIDINLAIEAPIRDFLGEFPVAEVEVNILTEGERILADQFFSDMVLSLLQNSIVHNNKKMKRVWIDVQKSYDDVILSISDNGPGLPSDRKKFLFDKSRRFAGVGLHQVKHIVDKYHGRIEVFDRIAGRQQSGTTFKIWLPVYHDSSE
jgi:PAS domain S-box-containing protein